MTEIATIPTVRDLRRRWKPHKERLVALGGEQPTATAKASVLAQAYSFTSAPIAKALLHAHKRGVQVQVILDKSQKTEKYSEADFLVNVGIPVQIDAKHAIAHNKIMIIDGQTVVTGSFNFTTAAEKHNAENLLVIGSAELAAKYAANWKVHADHSDPYEGKTQGYSETYHAAAEPPNSDAASPIATATSGFVASSRSQVSRQTSRGNELSIPPSLRALSHPHRRAQSPQDRSAKSCESNCLRVNKMTVPRLFTPIVAFRCGGGVMTAAGKEGGVL